MNSRYKRVTMGVILALREFEDPIKMDWVIVIISELLKYWYIWVANHKKHLNL